MKPNWIARILQLALLSAAPAYLGAVNRTLTISAPASVYAGQSFSVPSSASTDASDGEQIGFFHKDYSTNGGASWTPVAYDVNVGGSATRYANITAGAAGTTVVVRTKIAYRGGSAGDVDYNGNAIDWGGSWDNWGQPPTKYAYISVVTPPNSPPTGTLTSSTTSVYVGESISFTVNASDADGNLNNLNIDVSGSANGYFGPGSTFSLGAPPNNGNHSVGSAGSAFRTITVTFLYPGTFHFVGRLNDPSGWYSTNTITVTVPNRNPSGSLQILDAAKAPIALNGNGRAEVLLNKQFYVRVNGSDPDGRLGVLYSRLNNPSGAGVDYPHVNASGGNASHDFGPYTVNQFGVWDVWGHVQDADAAAWGSISPWTGNDHGWWTSHAPDVEVINHAPTNLTLVASGTGVEWNATNGHSTMWVDTPVNVTSTLDDIDGNLYNHTLRYQRVTGAGPIDSQWIILGNDSASNGYSSTKQASGFVPTLTGRWDFNAFGHDTLLSHPGNSITIWVYGPTNGAQFVSQSVDTSPMEIGSTRQVSVTFKNSGDKPWNSDATPHRLGSQNPADTQRWGLNRINLSGGETVVPTAQKTFTFTITAPTTPGTYDFQWRMVEDGAEWFGDLSPNLQIPVVDTTKPTVPTNFRSTGSTPSSVTLAWNASTDGPGTVAGYRIYRNGSSTPLGSTNSLTFTDSTVAMNNTYNYVVRAYDTANNESDPSPSISVFVQNDAEIDTDGDGWSNAAETNRGSNPNVYDQGTSTLGNGIPAGWPISNANPANAVGSTTGELSVDHSGALTYSIPIWTTPGTAGMEPKISLNYSSQSGGGIAGFGWSVGGISAITRGGQSLLIDGKNKGVTLTSDDRFYLDGQRLLVINGSYGTAGSEYRTELDSISKIVANGSAGSGPASFTVWTKAGLKIEFGNTPDSTFDAWGRAEKISWHVNRISDTKGNYIDFEYFEDALNGIHRLDRIKYTGNGGVAPYASLRFEYEDRPDTSSGYIAGSPVSNLKRLKHIRSYFGETVARTYTLAYSEAAVTSRSFLASITETGSDGKSYPPLTFEYEGNDAGWDDGSAWLPPYYLADNTNNGRPAGSGFVDLDGDGRTDFVARRDGAGINMAYRNTGSGWTSDTNYLLPHPLAHSGYADDQGGRFADVNGDGLIDYLWRKHVSSGAVQSQGAYLNTGSGWSYASQWLPPAATARDSFPNHGGRFVDIDGDGRVDFVAHFGSGYNLYVYLNNGNGWSFHAGFSTISHDVAYYKSRFIDLNGDGLVDIACYYHGSGQTLQKTWINTGTGWQDTPAYYLPQLIADDKNGSIGAEFIDANGDGLPDLLWYRELTSSHQRGVAINTGAGWNITAPGSDLFERFAPPGPLARDGEFNAGSAFIDVNLDGMPDYLKSRKFPGIPEEKSVHFGNLREWTWPGAGAAHELPFYLLQENILQTGADFVDLNGDGAVDVVWSRLHADSSSFSAVRLNRSKPTNGRLKKVTNGLGVAVSVAYASLFAPGVYSKAANNDDLAPYMTAEERAKVINVTGPMYVVRDIINDNGANGTHTITYFYANLRAHRERGSLGFGWMKVHDTGRDFRTQTTFRQDYPFIGQARYVKLTRVNDAGPLLSESTTTWAVKLLNATSPYPSRLVYASSTEEKTYDYGTQSNYLTTTTTSGEPDDYGNVATITVATSDGFTKTTTSTYFAPDTTNWILGRLQSSTVSSTGPSGFDPVTRTSSFTYSSAGLLASETVEPNNSVLSFTTSYAYDQFGNRTSATPTGVAVTVDDNGNYSITGTNPRTTTTQYDSNGRFPVWTENAIGHRENYTNYDQVLGVLKTMRGANDLPTDWVYDGFGRKQLEVRSDGTQTITTYGWTPGGYLADSLYYVESESTGAAPVRAHYDKLGRARWSQSIAGNGKIVLQETRYDRLSRVSQTSVPYFNDGSPVYWSTTTYDGLDRPEVVTTPDDENGTQTSTYSYSGFTGTVTDPKGRVTETVKNSQGWTLSNTRDKNGADQSTVSYGYDAIGNLRSTNAAGVVTTISCDGRGRKESMTDADMGTWHYRYNGFGELIWQKDAAGQIVRLSYDNLGRLTQRVESEGTTTWTYDSPSAGGAWKGKLYSVSSPGGYSETHNYDSQGRPTKVSRTIDGTSYDLETGYDTLGRPNRVTYPGTGLTSAPFSTRNVYNDFGYLKEIRYWIDSDTGKPNNQLTGKVYWMADSYHVSGRIDGETYGNGIANDRFYSAATGRLRTASIDRAIVTAPPYAIQQLTYTYDGVGNVLTRADAASGRTEGFIYDRLDRLTRHDLTGSPSVTVAYDARGNITSKSDVGAYAYAGPRPHAVTSAGVHTDYAYDANGNMTYGGGRTLLWTSFNQAKKLTDNASGKSSEFFFGAARERVKQLRRTGSTLTDTTIYVGSLYEKVVTAATGLVEHKHYIVAPTGRIAVHTERSDFTKDTRFFHTDGLGSITVVTDERGQVLKRYAYDAWGRQSTLFTATGSGIANAAPSTRGYTDHEMLADLGLIHMNGRVYDPVLGRFLSADPHIDDARDSQGFNRYSYVGNNPMNATDPTGYFKLKDALKIAAIVAIAFVASYAAVHLWGIKAAANAAGGVTVTVKSALAAALPGSTAVVNGIIGGLAGGFASGFAGSLLNGGSVSDAFKAGVVGGAIGALTGGIAGAVGDAFGHAPGSFGNEFGRATAHGAAGGAIEEIQGGEFRHGFYAGFAASAAAGLIRTAMPDSVTGRTIAAAVVGGTASALGGGKFANGAVTAAFSHLFNHESGSAEKSDRESEEVLVLLEEYLGNSPSLVGKRAVSEIKIRERWWVAASEIRKLVPNAKLTIKSYSDPEELLKLISQSRADRILISAHGGTGYIDAGAGTLSAANRRYISDLANDIPKDQFRKLHFHHCLRNNPTSWVQGVNILRSFYGLPEINRYKFNR